MTPTNPFAHSGGILHAERVPLTEIALRFGTPCYVYSRNNLLSRLEEFKQALGGLDAMVCFAVKANSNIAILTLSLWPVPFPDCSPGGYRSCVAPAGAYTSRVVFSGVGKTAGEIRLALEKNIFCFNVESVAELERLNDIAGQIGKKAPIALRVNPDVDPKTHPYISTGLRSNKFGVAYARAEEIYHRAHQLKHLDVAGIACHIGSQLLDPAPAAEATGKILKLTDLLAAAGIVLRHIDLGGGIGIRYHDETPPAIADYLAPILGQIAGRNEKIIFEPGRVLVGNAGILLTRIEHLKHGEEKNFAIVDAAMNDLMRPALYDAWHDILPVQLSDKPVIPYEVVGPVCESGDFLGHDRPLAIAEGDLLAVMSAGAYGMVMSSNYNSRPRAAEVIVDGGNAHLVRPRESTAELFAHETLLP